MMSPDTETNNTDSTHTLNHTLSTKDIPMNQALQGHTNKTKDRQDNNLDLWMTEEPEEMLLQYRITS